MGVLSREKREVVKPGTMEMETEMEIEMEMQTHSSLSLAVL